MERLLWIIGKQPLKIRNPISQIRIQSENQDRTVLHAEYNPYICIGCLRFAQMKAGDPAVDNLCIFRVNARSALFLSSIFYILYSS
jgi:hypothetical protein